MGVDPGSIPGRRNPFFPFELVCVLQRVRFHRLAQLMVECRRFYAWAVDHPLEIPEYVVFGIFCNESEDVKVLFESNRGEKERGVQLDGWEEFPFVCDCVIQFEDRMNCCMVLRRKAITLGQALALTNADH
jgi:hypothetical protein